MVIIDDNYTLGPPHHIFSTNKALFAVDLEQAGLELQPANKSQWYITEEYRHVEWDEIRGDVPNGMHKDSNGHAVTVDDNALPPWYHYMQLCQSEQKNLSEDIWSNGWTKSVVGLEQ